MNCGVEDEETKRKGKRFGEKERFQLKDHLTFGSGSLFPRRGFARRSQGDFGSGFISIHV